MRTSNTIVRLGLITLMVSVASVALAQSVSVLDINTASNASSSSPANFIKTDNGKIFFTATDLERGNELWTTDGTGNNTVVLKDINPGSSSSSPSNFLKMGNYVYFSANDGVHGSELWRSDGTANGTTLVADIETDVSSSSPASLIAAGANTIYFVATRSDIGRELFRYTISTNSLTSIDINTDVVSGSNQSSSPAQLTYAGGYVYFTAFREAEGRELWRYYSLFGVPTAPIEEIGPGTTSGNISGLTAVDPDASTKVVFSAYTDANGQELWRSTGTASGTYVVDVANTTINLFGSLITIVTYDAFPSDFVQRNGTVYFSAANSAGDRGLYSTTGSSSTDWDRLSSSSNLDPEDMVVCSTNVLFFSGIDSGGDRELYKYSSGSVTRVSDINTSGSSSPINFEVATTGTTVYFSATTSTFGRELYTSNGTTTTRISDVYSGANSGNPSNLFYDVGLYCSANDGSTGTELYLYNGSTTSRLKDINGGTEDSNPTNFVNSGTSLYFSSTRSDVGYELWSYNGTTLTNYNIASSTTDSDAIPLLWTGSALFFRANDGTNGIEPFVTPGNAATFTGYNLNASGSSMSGTSVAYLSPNVFFAAEATTTIGREVYKFNPATPATAPTLQTNLSPTTDEDSNPSNFTKAGSWVFFTATVGGDTELYRTNGSTTSIVQNINISGSSSPSFLTEMGTFLYFVCNDGTNGTEIYKTTTAAGGGGASRVTNINTTGDGNSVPQNLTALNVNGTDFLFFSAVDGVNGAELWVSDGTANGVNGVNHRMVKNINASTGSNPSNLTVAMSADGSASNLASTIYFTASDGSDPGQKGTELYRVTGGPTLASFDAVLVKDIFSGSISSSPTSLKNINGTLYFRASNGNGLYLMKTNGTSAGTVQATSSGISYQNASSINYMAAPIPRVYFVGTSNDKGTELLSVEAEPANQPASLNLTVSSSTQINGSFSGASGAEGYIVIRNAGSAPTGVPLDGPSQYSAGNSLTTGTGTVVASFTSATTNFSATGLTSSTQYYFEIYSWIQEAGGTYIYRPHAPLSGNATTFSAEPTTQATMSAPSSIGQTSMTISWTGGDGAESIVLAQASSAVTATPSDGTAYTGNSVFNSAPSVGGAKVVYRGSGSSVTVTVPPAVSGTTYHFRIYELNGSGIQTNYLTTQPAGAATSATTLAQDGNQPTDLLFNTITDVSMFLQWTAATAGTTNSYIVLRKSGSDNPTDLPTNGVTYTAGVSTIGSSTVVFNSAPAAGITSFTSSGLTAGTTYYYRVYGKSAATTYITTNPLAGSRITFDSQPANGPTALVIANPTPTSLSGAFTAATGSPAATGYLVLQKNSAAVSPDAPIDGTSYVVGDVINSSTVVYVGATAPTVGSPFVSDDLDPNTVYHFAAFSFKEASVNDGSINYNPTASVSSRTTLVNDPVDQPSDFVFENVTTTTADISFAVAPTEPGDGYIVVRRAGSAVSPPNIPVDGTAYTAGVSLGASTVVAYVGTANSFNDTGLTPNTTYHYAAASVNGSGAATNYLLAGNPTGNITTLSAEPTAQPTALTFPNRTTTAIDGSFTAASGTPAGYLVTRVSTATATTPEDGTTYVAGDPLGLDQVVYFGSSTTFTDNGLSDGTQYHYAVFSYNGSSGSYNFLTTTPLEGSVFTITAIPADQPTNMVVENPAPTSLSVDFDEAATTPTGYIVIRKQDTAPTETPVNGTAYVAGNALGTATVAYVGPNSDFVDNGLTANKVYHYAAFSFNGAGSASAYLTTSPLTGNRTTLQTEPLNQPTAISFTNLASSSLAVGFTASDAAGYLVLRADGSTPPAEVPVDGTSYTIGGPLGTSTVFAVGTAGIPLAQTGLTAASTYSYAIYAFNGINGANNYKTSSPLTGTVSTLTDAPTAQPTALSFSVVQTENMTVSWTAPATVPGGYLVVRKAGSAATGLPSNGASYTAGDTFGDATVAYVGTATNFIDTGLIGATDYYYQVFAFNGSGATTNYLTASPASGHQLTFDWEPLNQPTALTFTNVTTTGFKVSFTPDPDDFASGHIAIRRNGSDPTGAPVDGTTYVVGNPLGDGTIAYVGSADNFTETLAIAPYHYAVFAYIGSGASINYKSVSPLTGTLPVDGSAPIFTNATPSTVGSGTPLTVSYTINDPESNIAGPVTLEYKAINAVTGAPYNSTAMTLNVTSGKYEKQLIATDIGEQGVFYRVKATNGHGVLGTSPLAITLVSVNGLTLPALEGSTEQSGYKIIAIPLVLANKAGNQVFSALGDSKNGANWRMFHYSAGATTEITNLSNLTVEPGLGYWLLTRNGVTISPGAGNAVPVTETTPFVMNLSSGWNQIGNPYLFNILWSDVNTANGTNLNLRVFNGSMQGGTTLQTFQGGFVQTGGNVALSIPTAKNPAAGREHGIEAKTNPIDSEDWEVIINLTNGSLKNPFGGVGMSKDAKLNYDYLDDFTLPRFLNFIELNHNKKAFGMTYTKDILPLAENHTWDMNVDANVNGLTELTWDNSYFGVNDKQLILWDEEAQMGINMRETRSYSFAQTGRRIFKVIYGRQEYVDSKVELNGLRIHSISPNPASSIVKVAFSLPGSMPSAVNVRVVNNLGQQVATIFEGSLDAGYHELAWSGTDVQGERPATGVYLVEVINGEVRTSKRLMIK